MLGGSCSVSYSCLYLHFVFCFFANKFQVINYRYRSICMLELYIYMCNSLKVFYNSYQNCILINYGFGKLNLSMTWVIACKVKSLNMQQQILAILNLKKIPINVTTLYTPREYYIRPLVCYWLLQLLLYNQQVYIHIVGCAFKLL